MPVQKILFSSELYFTGVLVSIVVKAMLDCKRIHWDNTKLDIVSDITSIPLPDASVDAIMCTEVFEHIPDPIAAVKEFGRLVKPGGYLLITAPFASLTHFAPYHFASGLSRFFYEKHLPDQEFRNRGISF